MKLANASRSYGDFHLDRTGVEYVLRFEDVDPGTYAFELRDPRFEVIRIADLEPGGKVPHASLRGSSRVLFRVRDSATSEPVAATGAMPEVEPPLEP